MKARNMLIAAVVVGSLTGASLLHAMYAEVDKEQLERELDGLVRQRVATAELAYRAAHAAYESGTVTFDQLADANRELARSQVAAAASHEQEISARVAYVVRCRELERKCKGLFDSGSRGGEASIYYPLKYQRQTAEIELVEARLTAEQ